jgi:hypothetical protein
MIDEYWESSPFGKDSIFNPSFDEKQKEERVKREEKAKQNENNRSNKYNKKGEKNGNSIKYVSNMTEQEKIDYEAAIIILKKSDLFNSYYSILESSKSDYYIDVDENYIGGGKFDHINKTVTVKSCGSLATLAQELFHAFQYDLGVYNLKDRSDKEAEGDIMTHYVAVEASLPVSGILSEMVETWGKDIFNISEQKYSKNPTNMQVQSSEYDELFIKASKDRVEFFKNKVKNGEVTYKPYTSESSSQKPLAIKAVFKLVADKKN